jgi:hypothetical protein
MKRRTGVLAAFAGAATLSLGLAIGTGASALAAPASSTTQTVHQTWDLSNTSITPPNPCTGNDISGTARTNLVNHITVHGDEIWATFTETDRVTITDAGTGENYSGEFTFWGNYNLNQRNTNNTFTGNGHLRGDQGGSITFHEVSHFTMNANGQVTVSFDNPTMTCG